MKNKTIIFILLLSALPITSAMAKSCSDVAKSVQRSNDMLPDSLYLQQLSEYCEDGVMVREAGGDLHHFRKNISGQARAFVEQLGLDADDKRIGEKYVATLSEAGILGYKYGDESQ